MAIEVVKLEDIKPGSSFFGEKTLNLQRCAEAGFRVPRLIAIPSNSVLELLADNSLLAGIVEKIIALLPCEKYAIRSSALMEDGKEKSFAGRFLTVVDVTQERVGRAIMDVIEQACTVMDLQDGFSLIIQEFVAADISGVFFSRNPAGGREMVLEYADGNGDGVVGGVVKTKSCRCYWENSPGQNWFGFVGGAEVATMAKELENLCGWPQDVEWCIKDGVLFLLQTRNITTITTIQYQQMVFLDNYLKGRKKYFFQKTEISQATPRPSTATFDLLRNLYSAGGPIAKVYGKFGVAYQDTDFLVVLGNELFVDIHKEKQSLLPLAGEHTSGAFMPAFYWLSGALTSLRNLLNLNLIRTDSYCHLFQAVKERLANKEKCVDADSALRIFLSDYELVFEINLLAGLSAKKLDVALKGELVSFVDLVEGRPLFVDYDAFAIVPPEGLVGNSIDLQDEACFVPGCLRPRTCPDNVKCWWDGLHAYKKKFFLAKIKESLVFDMLREYGRWLAVKNINAVRKAVLATAKASGLADNGDIFFSPLDDILSGFLDKRKCAFNKASYFRYIDYSLPTRISSELAVKEPGLLAVSAGTGTGRLVTKSEIDAGKHSGQEVVLYAETLSPDLFKYIGKVSGIVAGIGGLLSHMAILARESGVPVVSNFTLRRGVDLGDLVRIDGNEGTVKKI